MIQNLPKTRNTRLRLTMHGIVQGVGFRPFVYRLANELHLAGWVENSPQGVNIEVEGSDDRLNAFRRRLDSDKPPLATILSCEASALDPCGHATFEIRKSQPSGTKSAIVLPDIATCAECLHDILKPTNRRYRYPFTNCTHCGPRFSIIEALPYDRSNTSMKCFAMCDHCRHEYANPADRRFHAQPNACPECGPQLELWDDNGRSLCNRHDALVAAAKSVREGRILALKGLGGFQLIVDARNEHAVAELRHRKQREEKPLAIMTPSLSQTCGLCHVGEVESNRLQSPQAPIVLLRRRTTPGPRIASSVAPGNPYLGAMLPYTPLHHVLMRELGFPVVATSGNLSDEPICTDEREAMDRLFGIADLFLVHDRPIVRHVDDSVVRVIRGREMVLRRSRGLAPLPVPTNAMNEPILALGAHQKNTVALATSGQVFISQHIGDLVTQQSYDAFDRATHDLPLLYDVKPSIVARDLHPDYLSTKHAEKSGCELVRVQHHHAHIASCMAENDLHGTVLGVAWDGAGYGPDGTVWGGEFIRCNYGGFERVAHMRTFPLPGGDLASREPRRSALGLLYEIDGDSILDRADLSSIAAFDPAERRVLRGVLRQKLNCPATSSMGRLFDAVASILNIRQEVRSEGQAATELECAASESRTAGAYSLGLDDSTPAVFDWRRMIAEIMQDLACETPLPTMARKFHNTLIELIVAAASKCGEQRVVMSGGCFQNQLLLEGAIARLENEGFRPYWHQRVPPNDGGIALGQAVVAQHRTMDSSSCA